MKRSGGCLCGAVRFTVDVKAATHGACHCGMCRQWCGGAPFFSVATTHATFEGEAHIGRYASSEWAERGFCKTCGTTLFYFFKPAELYSMGVGTLDDASAFRLDEEIFIDNKPDGYALAGDHARLTGAETLAKYAPSKSS